MINRVVLVGRLTRDPELKYTATNVAVDSFTVAVNRMFKNAQGEREADFINCVIWRKAAENFAKFTSKGSLVGIDGHIQTRNYENKQGNRVYVTEAVVDNFSLLESKNTNSSDNTNDDSSNQSNNSNNNNNQSNNSSNSSNSNNNMSDPFAGNSKPIDISSDDLPF